MSVQACAVVVAYNNPGELTRLLSSLNNQNDALCGLVIIDNSDEPYSEENKKAFTTIASQYVFSRYHKNKNNIGPTGVSESNGDRARKRFSLGVAVGSRRHLLRMFE
jgi:GT2 family glycosyltransferase